MKNYFSLFISCFFVVTIHSQVGINTTTPEAALDIKSTSNGLLIPRVSLSSFSTEAPVFNPQGGALAVSTLVYNDGSLLGPAGYYYWNGVIWVAIGEANVDGWKLTGNSGTNTSTNFIGTTDDVDFVFKRNNNKKMNFVT